MTNILKTLLGAGAFAVALSSTSILLADNSGLPDPGFEIVQGRTALLVTDPQNDFLSPKGVAMGKAPRMFKPAQGSAYGRIETPKGELGFYLVSDGSARPYRYHVRAPSFVNLTILEDMCLGQKVADAIVILGSVDIVLGEVDR